jgi:radical SAM protein with 4Fe4S-binding SPASM domain
VYPCVSFIDAAPALGNVHERPLGDILHDPAAWAFYQRMRPVNGTCQRCPEVMTCRGGSRALSRFAAGDWFALDPRCSGEPHAQVFRPVCFMLRENIATGSQSGFTERVG